MKRTVALILTLCLALLAGCAVRKAPAESAALPQTAAAEPAAGAAGEFIASDSDAPAEPVLPDDASETDAEEFSAPLPEETLPPAGLTFLSLDELVADAEGTGGQLPRLLPDCPGAASINEDIEGVHSYLVGQEGCTLYYQAYKYGEILSLLIAENFDGESAVYTPYLLDLSTGERIRGGELMEKLGLDPAAVAAKELEVMTAEFEYQFGGMSQGDTAAIYEEQLARTADPENAELDQLWTNDSGELWFVARIWSLAGPEFREYPMFTGIAPAEADAEAVFVG